MSRISRHAPTASTPCPGCAKGISHYRFSSMGGMAPHFYCDRCSNVFFRESDADRLRIEPAGEALVGRIAATLPGCPCGGHFRPGANPKCPHCGWAIPNRLDPVQRLTDPFAILVEGAVLVQEEGSTDSLLADIERALVTLGGPAVQQAHARPVLDALQRQLEWCRDYVSGLDVPEHPGSFSMGIIATREMDMYGDQRELAELINAIEREVLVRVSVSGDRHSLAAIAFDVADLHRDRRLTRKQAMSVLRRKFPGLPDDELEAAFSRGMFESR